MNIVSRHLRIPAETLLADFTDSEEQISDAMVLRRCVLPLVSSTRQFVPALAEPLKVKCFSEEFGGRSFDPLAYLSELLVYKTFAYLASDPGTLASVSRVSKRWHHLYERNAMWWRWCRLCGFKAVGSRKDSLRIEQSKQPVTTERPLPRANTSSDLPIHPAIRNPALGVVIKTTFPYWKAVYAANHIIQENWRHGYYRVAPVRFTARGIMTTAASEHREALGNGASVGHATPLSPRTLLRRTAEENNHPCHTQQLYAQHTVSPV